MAKRKRIKRPLVPLLGRGQAIPPYESYNPLLEEDGRVNRRFSVGLASSVLANVIFFGGAAAIASQVSPPSPDEGLPPAQFTLLDTKPEPSPTPPPPVKATPTPPVKVAQVRPTPPPPDRVRPTPPPERERPKPERIKPTPPPTQVAVIKPTPPPQVRPTPEPTPEVKPTPVALEQQKQPDQQTVETPAKQVASAANASRPRQITEVPRATTEALAPKREMGSSAAVEAPTHRTAGPIGATTTAIGPRNRKLSDLTTPAAAGAAGGVPGPQIARAEGMAGAGPALNARVAPATGASNNIDLNAQQTATAGNASVMSPTATRQITGPLAMTGPHLARSKALTALSPTDRTDANSFSYQQGGVVTAGKIVGTQGSTAARVAQVASAGDAVEARFEGVNNGIPASSRGTQVIRGPRVAAGSPGLAGPRGRTGIMLGSAGGQMGAPGNFNSAEPGGGGVRGAGTGGGGGGSFRARGIGGVGNGGYGSGLSGQYSEGTQAVASSRIGHPNNGPDAHNGAAFGPTKARGTHLTSVGGLDGPDTGAGSPEGSPHGLGRAGLTTGGRGVSVEGSPTGSSVGFHGEGGGGTSVAEGGGGGRGEGIRSTSGGLTNTGAKIGRSEQARPVRIVQPQIPDNLKSQSFKTSVDASVTVHKDGSSDVELTQGSGNSQIDALVLRAMRGWKWKPAIANNVPTEQTLPWHFDFQVK